MKDLSLTVRGMREMHQIRHIQSCSLPGYCSWFADSSYGRSQGMTQSCLVVLGPDFAAGNNVQVARAWEGQARGFSCPFVLGVQLTFIECCWFLLFGSTRRRRFQRRLGFASSFDADAALQLSQEISAAIVSLEKKVQGQCGCCSYFSFVTSVLWLPSFVLVVLVSFRSSSGLTNISITPAAGSLVFHFQATLMSSISFEGIIALSRVARLLHSKNFALLWFHLQFIPAQGSRYNDKGCIHFMDVVDIVSGHPF